MEWENNSEAICRRLQNGELENLGTVGEGHTKRMSVVMTSVLYRSCFWAFPRASQNDRFDHQAFVSELHDNVVSVVSEALVNRYVFRYLPETLPVFLNRDFAIEVTLQKPYWVLLSVTGDHAAYTQLSLPMGLIVRLYRCVAKLWHHARFNERAVVFDLLRKVRALAEQHIMCSFVDLPKHNDTNLRDCPKNLTREEYRGILLNEVHDLIEVAQASGLSKQTGKLLGLAYDNICTPLNEVLHLTHSLIRLAASSKSRPEDDSPFNFLLVMHSMLRALALRGDRMPPRELLDRLSIEAQKTLHEVEQDRKADALDIAFRLSAIEKMHGVLNSGAPYPVRWHRLQ